VAIRFRSSRFWELVSRVSRPPHRGNAGGLLRGGVIAISPQQVAYGLVGRIDHNVPGAVVRGSMAGVPARREAATGARAIGGHCSGAVMALAFWFITTATL
jgi:hypothetical protein